jgi:hypothetical protein
MLISSCTISYAWIASLHKLDLLPPGALTGFKMRSLKPDSWCTPFGRLQSVYFFVKSAIFANVEYQSYNHAHATVCHGQKEWARDDDGDGIREVHVNTAEGMWTDVRNFLRSFKGVHKKNLSGYIAICEFRRNLKRISPDFISALVTPHTFYP